MDRGSITHDTLNRIESKQAELADALEAAGNLRPAITNVTTWTGAGYFTGADLRRLCDNSRKLIDAFTAYATTPEAPEAVYTYQTLNALEQILVDLEELIDNAEAAAVESGEIETGGETP